MGKYNRGDFDIINDHVSVANFNVNDLYSEHHKSNVYIAAYVTAYARMKLYAGKQGALLGQVSRCKQGCDKRYNSQKPMSEAIKHS